jgi:hypothetical protein
MFGRPGKRRLRGPTTATATSCLPRCKLPIRTMAYLPLPQCPHYRLFTGCPEKWDEAANFRDTEMLCMRWTATFDSCHQQWQHKQGTPDRVHALWFYSVLTERSLSLSISKMPCCPWTLTHNTDLQPRSRTGPTISLTCNAFVPCREFSLRVHERAAKSKRGCKDELIEVTLARE